MYITGEVDIPLELIEAHSAGKLVLFVGAGVSLNAPSGLPLFGELAEIIGEEAHHHRGKNETVDHFLGRISVDLDVREQVRRIIGRSDSQPNSTHSAVVNLLAASPTLRLITTNFDEHIDASARDTGITLGTKYLAPALPVGRDFEGIAYLHGAVSQPAGQLIVTDRDFGRAYLTDAWATRFLQQVFDNFVVLFVGYSHTDPIVSYLGLGLPSNAKSRFVLTHEPHDERWEYLGIQAIGYSPDREHAALPEVLDAWAKRATMGQLDHDALIARIAKGAPPATPVEADYLIDALQNSPEAASVFAENARGAEWLLWAEQLPAFRGLFTLDSVSDRSARVLAKWFADVFVADPAQQTNALLTISRLGLHMTDALYEAICRSVNDLAEADIGLARRWLALLATSVPGHSAPRSTLSLAHSSGTLFDHAVLEQIVRPQLSVQRNVILEAFDKEGPAVRADLAWSVDYDTAQSYWSLSSQDEHSDVAKYLPTFERALGLAYDLVSALNGTGFDGLSFGRSAIEPHPQDAFPEMQDFIIDILRDSGKVQYATDPGIVQRWLELGHPLFQRLAIHLISDGPLSDSEKINWLIEQELLWSFEAKHERFILLQKAVPNASSETRGRLLTSINEKTSMFSRVKNRAGASASEDDGAIESDQYEIYNLLVWLERADPSWADAINARDRVRGESSWEPRDHPDMHSWMSSGSWHSEPPFSKDEFESFLSKEGAHAALKRLLAIEYGQASESPQWSDALNLIRDIVSSSPENGLELWSQLDSVETEQSERSSMIDSILQGWTSATLSDDLLARALQVVRTQTSFGGSAWSIARFISEQMRLMSKHVSEASRSEMRSIAAEVWEMHARSVEPQDEPAPPELSLNAWPGLIARFWVLEISARWQANLDNWQGLNATERDAIEQITSRIHEGASQAATPALTREVVFLFNADRDYAAANIIPLFDGDIVPLAWSWGSYLHHPAWNDGLLEQGFYEHLLEVIGRLAEVDISRGLRHQFISLLINVVAFSNLSPERRSKLLDMLVIQGTELTTEALREIIRAYVAGKPSDYGSFWDLWLSAWMRKRIVGLPRKAQAKELSAWADLVPFVGAHAGRALEIFGSTPAAIDGNFKFPIGLSPLQPVLPIYLAHIVGRIELSDPSDYLTTRAVARLLDALIATFGLESVAVAVEAAGQRGIKI